MPKEPMLLYIAATNRVVSAVIVVERDEGPDKVQRPVYYLSEVLSQSKQNYPHYQKMAYGVYMAAKKLKHYFQSHPIKVVKHMCPRYYATKMQVAGSSNGLLSYHRMYLSLPEGTPSNPKLWQISLLTGLRCSISHPVPTRTSG